MKYIYRLINDTEIDSLRMLNNTNHDAKEEFINDSNLRKPNNRYGAMDIEKVENNIRRILKGLKKLDRQTFEGSLFASLLNDNLYHNELVKSCYEYNNGNRNQNLLMTIKDLNGALYGKVERKEFRKILAETYAAIDVKNLDDQEKKELEELNELLPYIPRTNERPYRPSERVFKLFSEKCEIFLADFMRHIPEKDVYTVQEVCDIANEIFSEEIDGYDWKAQIREKSGYASVSQEKRIFFLPGKRSKGDYVFKDVRAIIAHEIGVHVMRSIPYQYCEVRGMSIGSPGYIEFEEGLAKAVEQAINKEFKPSGYMHYISLGLGMYYGYDFRKVYETLWRLQKLAGKANKQQCFDSVQRAFRGTGEILNLKDVSYYNGNNIVWKYITKNINSETLFDDLFLSGKINSTNHYWSQVAYELKSGWRYSGK